MENRSKWIETMNNWLFTILIKCQFIWNTNVQKKKKKKSRKQKKYYNNNNNKHKLTKKTMIPRKVNSICLILFTHWTFRIIFLSIYINYEIIHKQSIILEIRIISDDMKLHCLPILFLFSCSWKSTIFNFIYLWHFI